ncbi:MAG: Ppx/GppA phosphatase family protein [Actinomycetes bacterium]
MDENLAAIDIGTNSIHLVVARFDDDGHFEVIADEKEAVRLGSGDGEMKQLAADAIDRGIATLTRFRQVAEISKAPVSAVATSAVREAENAEEFIARARTESGVAVEVISGVEEARLIYLGVLQAVPIIDKRMLLIDIGGGSTEILVGEQSETLEARSFKLGAIRLTRRFFQSAVLHPGAVHSCRKFVQSVLAPMARDIDRLGFDVCVGSSGTVEAIATVAGAMRTGSSPRTLNNATVTRVEVESVVEALAGAPTNAARLELPGVEAGRADIILGGAIILAEAMAVFGVDEIVVSAYALREGALLDAFQRRRGAALHHLHDLRRTSVMRLASLMDDEPEHANKVSELALALFDQLSALHGLGDDARELLEAAALLTNVGLFVSHSKHHKHSYYVIRNSDRLAGFTDHEIEIVALVARYHRKSAPSAKHPEFAALLPSDQESVRILAGLLRVAIGLDRTHAGLVASVHAVLVDAAVDVQVVAVPGADISLELYTASERSGLLAEVLHLPVWIGVSLS